MSSKMKRLVMFRNLLLISLREKAFKQSFRVLNNSEISLRLSDDIEIIAKSFILERAIIGLLNIYGRLIKINSFHVNKI